MGLSEDEEDFVTIGTRCDIIEEDESRKKPVRVSDMVVKDKQGRTRFHGAFTGGFSAGFFNTVGSKEGWTPSSFRSSRVERTQRQQKPEDFMDDEDFEEYGIAPKQIKTVNEYTSIDTVLPHKRPADYDPYSSTIAKVIVPNRTTIGIHLLRRMGWKEGQGIGPRESHRHRKKHRVKRDEEKSDGDDDSDDELLKDITFAPRDVCPVSFNVKNNVHGLDYSGIRPAMLPVSGDRSEFHNKWQRKGQAFGVGAFEEADDDIYAPDDLSKYDTIIGSEKPDDLHGWTAPRQHKEDSRFSKTGANFIGAVLEGFHLDSSPLTFNKYFPPPKVPSNFQPHRTNSDVLPNRIHCRLSKPISVTDRGLLIGEKPHLKSVFELVSPKDMNKMKSMIDNRVDALNASHDRIESLHLPPSTSTNVTTATTSSFNQSTNGIYNIKPFARNPDKQSRYEKYCEFAANCNKDAYSFVYSADLTEWEKEREEKEFEVAHRLYRPLSSMMSSRFTSGHFDDDHLVEKKDEEPSSDKDRAVQLKMFGRLTREELEWHPDNLLCKRFDVPNPYYGCKLVGLLRDKKEKVSVFNFLKFTDTQDSKREETKPKAIEGASSVNKVKTNIFTAYLESEDAKKQNTSSSVNSKTTSAGSKTTSAVSKTTSADSKTTSADRKTTSQHEEVKSNLPTEFVRDKESQDVVDFSENNDKPPKDLFRAVFANSDSDVSSTEDDDETPTHEIRVKPSLEPFMTNVQSSPSNIDILVGGTSEQSCDQLSHFIRPPIESRVETTNELSEVNDDQTFGPRLPPSSLRVTCSNDNPGGSSAPDDLPREDSRRHARHKNKRSKKSKHRHKKEKDIKRSSHKKKKRKKISSDSDDSLTGSDISDSELLQRLRSTSKSSHLTDNIFLNL